jgi:hypothetical protein
MLTGGQVSSVSTAGGAASPTACDFDPKSWLNLLPIEKLESDDSAIVLPPPQPDRTAPATPKANHVRRRTARPAPAVRIISL